MNRDCYPGDPDDDVVEYDEVLVNRNSCPTDADIDCDIKYAQVLV